MFTRNCLAFACLLGFVCSGSASAATAYKCTDADGKLSFQQMPCTGSARTQVVDLAPEIDPQRRAENEAQMAANHGSSKRSRTSDQASAEARAYRTRLAGYAAPAAQQPKPAPVCPPTRENPGRTPAPRRYNNPKGFGFPDLLDYSAAKAYVAQLPTKTYLKNGGRWPRGCPD
jgi:hypothetical protein